MDERSPTSNTWRSRTISGVNKYRAPAFCTVAHVCGSSVRNMLYVASGAQNFKLTIRFLKYLCTPGVDSCQDSCTNRFRGFNRGHRYCVLYKQFVRPHFSWRVIPFRVPQLGHLHGKTLRVMEILFSTFCAGFAKNVPLDERLHAPYTTLLNYTAIILLQGAFNNLSTWVRKKQIITKKNVFLNVVP